MTGGNPHRMVPAGFAGFAIVGMCRRTITGGFRDTRQGFFAAGVVAAALTIGEMSVINFAGKSDRKRWGPHCGHAR